MDLNQLYKSILESLDMAVDDAGLISRVFDGEAIPAECQGKRLALPTPERIRSGNWEGLQPFHPVSESVTRGESPVIKRLRLFVNLRLTETICELMQNLVEIAADSDAHGKLDPNQAEFLTRAPDANQHTVDDFEKVLRKASTSGPNRIVSVYLKRGGQLKGTKHSRLAVASFPVTDEFGDDKVIFGHTFRSKKNARAFQQIFDYLLPNAKDVEAYSYGSDSMTAPYFHALMMAYVKVAKQLNKTIRLFKKHLDDAKELMIDVSWAKHMDNLAEYRDLIPTLSGNEGEPVAGDDGGEVQHHRHATSPELAKNVLHDPAPEQPTQETPPPWQNSQPTPQPAPQPMATQPAPQLQDTDSGGAVKWSDVMRAQQQPAPPQYPPQAGYPPMPGPMGYGQPMPQHAMGFPGHAPSQGPGHASPGQLRQMGGGNTQWMGGPQQAPGQHMGWNQQPVAGQGQWGHPQGGIQQPTGPIYNGGGGHL